MKSVIIISTLVDSTIRESLPGVDVRLFKNVNELNNTIATTPLRAKTLFLVADALGETNAYISVLADIIKTNDFLNVDEVVYISPEDDRNLESVQYLKESDVIDWEIIVGKLTRAFIRDCVTGTNRDEMSNIKRRNVVLVKRQDYINEKLNENKSLDVPYQDDDDYMSNVELDVNVEERKPNKTNDILQKIIVAGLPIKERTAFALLLSQYIAIENKCIIVEYDTEYHALTDMALKSGANFEYVDMSELFANVSLCVERIKAIRSNLIVIGCKDRKSYNYDYIVSVLYFNLLHEFDYIVVESEVDCIPIGIQAILTIPTYLPQLLKTISKVDLTSVGNLQIVGIDLYDIPEVHIKNSEQLSIIVADLLSIEKVDATLFGINSLKISDAYDLGWLYRKGVSI